MGPVRRVSTRTGRVTAAMVARRACSTRRAPDGPPWVDAGLRLLGQALRRRSFERLNAAPVGVTRCTTSRHDSRPRRGTGGGPRGRVCVRERRSRRGRDRGARRHGVRFVALRSAGYNHVDLAAAAGARHHRRAGARVFAQRRGRAHPRARSSRSTGRSTAPTPGSATATSRSTASSASTWPARRSAWSAPGSIGALVARLLWHLRCGVLALRPVPRRRPRSSASATSTLDELLRRATSSRSTAR